MALLFAIFVVSIALVSAADPEPEKKDDLEIAAFKILKSVQSQMAKKGLEESQKVIEDDIRRAEKEKRTKDKIGEEVRVEGLTFVSVRKGKREANVTTLYGVGEAIKVNLRADGKDVDQSDEKESETELASVLSQFQDTYVKQFDERKGDEIHETVFEEGKSEVKVKDGKRDVRVKGHGGLVYVSKTKVSKTH